MTKIDLEKLEQIVKSLSSVQNEGLMDIIRGMYQGKLLLGKNPIGKRFNRNSFTRRDGR